MQRTIFNVPVGSQMLRAACHLLLRVTGWKVAGNPAPHKKMVVTAGPHTSNWDFLYTVAAASTKGLHLYWIGKHTLFKPPFGTLCRFFGGISVDRTRSSNTVAQMREAFERADTLHLLVPPKGSRSRRPRWKTGFWRIAKEAGVPVHVASIDFSRKVVTFHDTLELPGDLTGDIRTIQRIYMDSAAKHPENNVQESDLLEEYEENPSERPTGTG